MDSSAGQIRRHSGVIAPGTPEYADLLRRGASPHHVCDCCSGDGCPDCKRPSPALGGFIHQPTHREMGVDAPDFGPVLGWWDAMHDEGAHVAWGLWAEGRP